MNESVQSQVRVQQPSLTQQVVLKYYSLMVSEAVVRSVEVIHFLIMP